jgi:hypothetical protein
MKGQELLNWGQAWEGNAMRSVSRSGVLAAVLAILAAAPAHAADDHAINRAIDRGVAALRKKQRADGTWPGPHIGAAALAGLTLLECGAAHDDPAVLKAAVAFRKYAVVDVQTYSMALGILFLDRLGDPRDVPLIESMAVRLLGGQEASGGWSYTCPGISLEESERLRVLLRDSKDAGGRSPLKHGAKRALRDLSPETQDQLARLSALPPPKPGRFPSDNSNTQFAMLGLWVARRYGIPVGNALARVEARFRSTQNPDFGWGYRLRAPGAEDDTPFRSSATMTCVGIQALALAHGAVAEAVAAKEPKVRPRDAAKDLALMSGLAALSNSVGTPGSSKERSTRPGETFYYFLWSLERVCVTLDIEALYTKDWYAWGAEFLVVNQEADGTWQGNYGESGADTCFALLFLKRVNLLRDLSTEFKGKLKGLGERALHTGVDIKGPGKLKPPIEPDEKKPVAPLPSLPDTAAGRLAGTLVAAAAGERRKVLDRMRDGKGVEYTEALAAAIPRLDADTRLTARAALAQRLAHMKAGTIEKYLTEEEPEIRRAAALACGQRALRSHIPYLIPLLRDPVADVAQSAHAALKELTGENLAPDPDAWQAWWNTHKD